MKKRQSKKKHPPLKEAQKSLKPKVAIIMGSNSDYEVMKEAALALELLKIPHELKIISAHRTPEAMVTFAKNARKEGIRVIIAGAGGAAHLPGMVASLSELPVIGVPVPHGYLKGQDALLSIVQMPKGVPVATVAIGNAWNAGVLSAQILGVGTMPDDEKILDRVRDYKKRLKEQVMSQGLSSKSD